MAEAATDGLVEHLQGLRAELLRHTRDIDTLFRRADRDHHAIIVALSGIMDTLSQLGPLPNAILPPMTQCIDEKPETGPHSSIDHELSDALERISDLEVRGLFVRRLAELGHRTRMPEIIKG